MKHPYASLISICRSVGSLVGWLVCRLICHNFLLRLISYLLIWAFEFWHAIFLGSNEHKKIPYDCVRHLYKPHCPSVSKIAQMALITFSSREDWPCFFFHLTLEVHLRVRLSVGWLVHRSVIISSRVISYLLL